jgi:glycolate oxidase FAD binding subunit
VSDLLKIDGFGPLPVCRPASVPELGDLVREAAGAGQGVYPVGSGTVLDLGLPPIKPGFAVDSRELNKVIDYPARDLTITVQAGVIVGGLQKTLAAEGQRLPVDVPNADRSTLGGALAANLSGPRRQGFGTLRDHVIGISFVTDEGHEVQGGGRVVKNVAGYDLMKLQIGALGTLGVITQVTLKVTPRPEDQALVAFGLDAAAVGPMLDRLHASASRPMAVELLNAAAVSAAGAGLPRYDPWMIIVGFEEKATTVSWQVSTLKDELKAAPVRDLIEFHGPACEPIWAALTQLQDRPGSRLSFKANVLPSRVAACVVDASATHPDVILQAHAGSGIVWGHVPTADLTAEQASAILTALAMRVAEGNGNVVIRRCLVEWKNLLPVWGRPGSDRDVMRTVKQTVDPRNVFNPGRLFGGL